MSALRFSLRLFVIGGLAAIVCQAQFDTGTIRGTVRDSSGAVIAGARVTITNEGTSASEQMLSSESGNYTFSPLKIGKYTVEAEHPGFEKQRKIGIQLDIQQQAVVDFTLTPGEVTSTVDVTAAAPVLQTENGSVGQVVQSHEINDLPLNGRNYTFLARLVPGATIGQSESRNLNANGWFTANGTRPAENNYLLDGIDNNSSSVDFLSGAAYVLKPPIDAISEFNLQTSDFSAEFGRAGGAVLNASIKSGTNQFHGDVWEFLRNDAIDAADFFQNANGQKKGEFRQNQFGAAAGGRIIKNKTFWFGDYEGTRIVQAVPNSASVPTALERNSGFTNFSDLISLQTGTHTDALGRTYPLGTIFDPATTRSTGGKYVRDPFPGNILPANRLDPNSIKLLSLYPAPTQAGLYGNYGSNPKSFNNANSFDIRIDEDFSDHDQMFLRYSWSQNPSFLPSPLPGVADGGSFNDGNQRIDVQGAALSYTHSFSATLVNEARVGFNREHTVREQLYGNDTSNIPAQFGIPGVLQTPGNGGLPYFSIGGLNSLGPAEWLVSDRYSNTVQFTENLTKVYKSHTFKTGVEVQDIQFPWTAPPYSRGEFDFSGIYTSIPNITDSSTGIAQMLLTPMASAVSGPGYVGGASGVNVSNFGGVAADRAYAGAFVQDDWKVSSKLTLNLGLRWDYFTPTGEKYDAQANFVPGTPFSGAEYIIPASRKSNPALSPSFTNLLATDGIQLVYTNKYGSGLSSVQHDNFAPRIGFAYRATPKFVVRGGYGIYYGAFENRGGYPSLGYNYPFQYTFNYSALTPETPITYPNGALGVLETGLTAIPLNPVSVNAYHLYLRGIQLNYKTPYVQSYNLTLEYQLTPTSVLQAGYVASLSRHLETFAGTNMPSELLPLGLNVYNYIPFPDFAEGASYDDTIGNANYHSLQTKYEKRYSNGLTALIAYTFSKTRTDAGDLLSGGGVRGFRAPDLPGWGIQKDMGLAPFDIRHAFSGSGSYELPFGKGKRWLSGGTGPAQLLLGNWVTNFILTLDTGQPQTIPCATSTGTGTGCYALYTGANPYGGAHNVSQFYNPLAFTTPAAVQTVGQSKYAPLGGGATQVSGPPYRRLDFSIFKEFPVSETMHFEFRAESFNLTNTPNFSLPSVLNYLDTVNFGKITSTRDAPNDARELQFALKFYW